MAGKPTPQTAPRHVNVRIGPELIAAVKAGATLPKITLTFKADARRS